ncbi:MAG TPA: efflux RND transporter permease subunit [Candidatus Limnocylindrales bacterium]|nr:efflux RND transporter permease subunit [Candidatus Limnocylindrales bacterium]
MSFSEPFIRRPVGTSLLAAGLFLAGIVAYQFLPVAPIPRVDFPMINVQAMLPGADPATVASTVAAPLERRLGQISGVSEITSVSTLGGTSISIQFNLDRNVDGAARDVQAAINAAAGDLPINLPAPPTYHKVNPADAPIMILAMTSDTLTPTQVYDYGDSIVAQKLSQIEGVSQVFITGAAKDAIRVQVNPAALASANLSLEDVRSNLSQVNIDQAKGSLEGYGLSYTLTSNDQLLTAKEYQRLVIAEKPRGPVRLSAMGRVVDSVENTLQAGWAGTNEAVLVIIFKQSDANVIDTVRRIKKELPRLSEWLPPSIKISPNSDRTRTIEASVHEVQFSLLLSIALVVMVIFLFLRRFWPTFIASITVPLALAATAAGMYFCHYSLDNLSLMAITISVGFVVDDAIVVIENIFRHIEHGEPAFEAALKGARQIGFTIVSMTTSLVAVFIPLLFMGGLIGRLFHEFAVTLSMAVLVSGVLSLTLTPMMCSRFLRAEASYGPPGLFYRLSERGFNWLLSGYETSLKWVLRHQHFMLVVFFVTLAGTISLYKFIPKGFFPQQDTGSLMGTTEAAQDISFKAMTNIHREVLAMVVADPAVEAVGSFVSGTSSTVNNGRLFITLKPIEQRHVTADQVIGRLRRKLSALPGIILYMQASQDIRVGGRMTKAQYQYALQSTDLDELKYWSATLLSKLRKNPLLRDVSTDQLTGGLESRVEIDRDAASRLGVSPAMIDNTLYDAFGQRQISTLYKRYNQHHVVLEAEPQFLLDPTSLNKIFIKSSAGKLIPLSTLAKFKTGNSYLSVNHQGQFAAVTLSFNLASGVSLGEATESVQRMVDELHLPSSVQGSFQGTAQVFKASVASTPLLALAALIAVYVVLGMLYESLIHPITILSTLPSAGVGALLALLATGCELSLVSFIGIILLIGIVKKNAILMIDFALEAERNENADPEDAIYRASVIRFRPIMMTTMAAMFGAVPLAIGFGAGSELRQPLGIAIVGGLIFSQAMTLFTTPVIYLAFERIRRWLLAQRATWLGARRRRLAPQA